MPPAANLLKGAVMLYAKGKNQRYARATPGKTGHCPACGEGLIPKCGAINVWHWSHKARDCDSWYEPETDWHLGWKGLVRPSRCEVVIELFETKHRADILANNDEVIELQHSPISADGIWLRETFYQNMVWVIDAQPFIKNIAFTEVEPQEGRPYYRFKWKWPRKTLLSITKPHYWDLGGMMFRVKKVNNEGKGWGRYMEKERFIRQHMSDVLDV